MRVITQNLWGRRGDWPARRAVLADGLRDLRPDLVAFQGAIVADGYDQVCDLLGPAFHLAHQRVREPGDGGDVEAGQGFSIASRWPLGEVREADLHVTPRTAELMADGRQVIVAGTAPASPPPPAERTSMTSRPSLERVHHGHGYRPAARRAIVGRTREPAFARLCLPSPAPSSATRGPP
jgi:hypothetical protein